MQFRWSRRLIQISKCWGTTVYERIRELAGEESLPVRRSTTYAITIAVPPQQVWPWLVQIWRGRGGFYIYTAIGFLVVVMAQTRIPAQAAGTAPSRPREECPPQASSGRGGHKRHLSPFWRHFLEMLAAMAVAPAPFSCPSRAQDLGRSDRPVPHAGAAGNGGRNDHPNGGLDVVPGVGRRNASEMAAAMVLPVVPFLCLVWFDVTESVWCGAYCATTIVAMLVLMRYRRSTYSNVGRATAEVANINLSHLSRVTAPWRAAEWCDSWPRGLVGGFRSVTGHDRRSRDRDLTWGLECR
jgi:hypothetical protein